MDNQILNKAALCGEPSYLWRDGQIRRFRMISEAAGDRLNGRILDNGCGIGLYSSHLQSRGNQVISLEYDFDRAVQAHQHTINTLNAAGECLPFPGETFDLILSHEVLEHVRDDRQAVSEMVRVLGRGGRLVLFTPNRGYPFETHGFYWRGKYHFGNIPLINYLPRGIRDKLAPHVRIYGRRDLVKLFQGLPIQVMHKHILFGAYDNIIARSAFGGRILRAVLQWLEHTPLQVFGLSHYWVIEKIQG
jgi:SAM-dependent methyltransferase